MSSAVLPRVKPMPAAAQPEYELSIEITTGMSAPPIGRIRRNPSSRAMAVSSQNHCASGFSTSHTVTAIKPMPSSALNGCWPGKVSGVPVMMPCSLPKAMTEPVKVIAPIAVPMLISMRLTALMLPSVSAMPKAAGE